MDNIFLNDLTRSAYTNNSNNNNKPLNENSFERFETDMVLNHKDNFETNNKRINELNDEILELKQKLKIIPEKDDEIYKLQTKNKELENKIKENNNALIEYSQLKNNYQKIKNENDSLKTELINNDTLKKENNLLKQKILSLIKEKDISINSNAEKVDENIEIKEEIKVDIIKLKQILYTRLKGNHEKHIDDLINEYDLQMKESIDKETMEQILIKAIHI